MKPISVLHPSYKRPQLAFECYQRWTSTIKNKENVEYILSLSDNDPQLEKYKQTFKDLDVVIITHPNNGWVIQLNHAAEKCTGNLFVCIGDDFSCPVHWDEQLLTALQDKEDYIVKTNDGIQPWIMTLPMMDRKYYNRFAYVVYPEYKHMWGDTELTHVADLVGRVVKLPILFPHDHYSTGKAKKDEVNIANDSTWKQGENLYIKHVKSNFGLSPEQVAGKLSCSNDHINWLKQKGVNV
jgi:hypothetical protein